MGLLTNSAQKGWGISNCMGVRAVKDVVYSLWSLDSNFRVGTKVIFFFCQHYCNYSRVWDLG